jgi:hypothetical protein
VGLDTVSMRYERTRAYLPRDAHPTGMARPGPSKAIPLPTAVFLRTDPEDQDRLEHIRYFGDHDRGDVMPEFAIVLVFLLAAFAISRLVQ